MLNIRLLKNNGGGRIPYIDVAKGVLMLFVIISHSGYVPNWLHHFYSPVFLSGFFFISGLFFLKVDGFNWASKFKTIVSSILVPYLLYWILSYSVDQILQGNYNYMPAFLHDVLLGQKLWFVSALFVVEAMAVLWFAFVHKHKIAIWLFPFVMLLAYCLTPAIKSPVWYWRPALLAGFYFGIGVLVSLRRDAFLGTFSNHAWGIASLGVYIILFAVDLLWIKNAMAFNYAISDLWYFIPESLVGIYAIIYLSKCLSNSASLLFIGANSLLFYFFQNQILTRLTRPLGRMLNLESPDLLYSLASALIVVLVLIIPICMVRRWLPIMAGQWRWK